MGRILFEVLTMAPNRSYFRFLAFVLLCGVFCARIAGAASTFSDESNLDHSTLNIKSGLTAAGFIAIPLGIPVEEWVPIDIDGDSMCELAVLSSGLPTRVGIFDPGSRNWTDGPHELTVEPKKWTACDLDSDGVPDYIYSSGLMILSREFTGDHPDSIGSVSVFPRGIVYWGVDSTGDQLIGIADRRYGGAHYLSYLLHVYSVTFWDSCFSVATAPSFPSESGKQVEMHGKRFVHDFWIDHIVFGTPQWFWKQRFDWVNSNGTVTKTLKTPVNLYQKAGGGFWDTWSLLAADTAQSGGMESPLVCWMLGIKTFGPSEDPYWTVWGCHADTGSNPLWQISDSSVSEYLDIVAYDLLPESGSEVIIPRRSDGAWEIRRATDGAILQVREDMPIADLSSECLVKTASEDLFYLADSTLYIYERDVQTGVFDDPDTNEVTSDVVTISAHPNPFNSAVTLSWSGTASSLTIFNVLGQSIVEMALDGKTSVTWDGCDSRYHECVSGIYIAQVASRNFTASTKIVLLR